MGFDWQVFNNEVLVAWVADITSAVGLFLVYWQLGQVKQQMVQSDEQAKFQRSWEFLRFYQEQLDEGDKQLQPYRDGFDPRTADPTSEAFVVYRDHFYQPRFKMFKLLNQLISLQQVDEQVLFTYLENDFRLFTLIGTALYGQEVFQREVGGQIPLLLTTWATKLVQCNPMLGDEHCPLPTAL